MGRVSRVDDNLGGNMLTSDHMPRRINTLIENRTDFYSDHSVLSIYDTHDKAFHVSLASDQLLYCGMLRGTKVMHTPDQNGESKALFLPHQSFVLGPKKKIHIDFPYASLNSPTTCLAIEICQEKIIQVADQLSQNISCLADQLPYVNTEPSSYMHCSHNAQTQLLLERLMRVFNENSPDRSMFIDWGVSELIVRMLRQHTQSFFLEHVEHNCEASALHAMVDYLNNNLGQPFDIDALCKVGFMSRSKLYKFFKKELGSTPQAMQQKLRLNKAVELLKKGHRIKKVSLDLGFADLSHFSRCFKATYGYSPREYNRIVVNNIMK